MIKIISNIARFLYQTIIAVLQGFKRLGILFVTGMECWSGVVIYMIYFSNYNGEIEAKEAKDLLKFYATISLGLTSLLVACVALVKEDIKKSNDLKNMVIRASSFLIIIFGMSALCSEGILLVADNTKMDVEALTVLREIFFMTVISMILLILEILRTTINGEGKKDKTSWVGDRKIVNMKEGKRFSIIDKLFTKNI